MRITSAIIAIATIVFSSPALSNGDIDWVWNGPNLDYKIIRLSDKDGQSGGQKFNCGNNGSSCSIQMYVDYIGPNERLLWTDSIPYISGTISKKDLVLAYNSYKLPKSGTVTNHKEKECIAIYARDQRLISMVGSTCGRTLTPPPPPPPQPSPLSCSLYPISLRHSALRPDEIDGNHASANMLLTCTRQATVRVKAIAGDGSNLLTLRADGSLTSTLTVNGIAGNTGVLVTVPGPSGIGVMFISTLHASGNVEPGNFNASGVAQINIL